MSCGISTSVVDIGVQRGAVQTMPMIIMGRAAAESGSGPLSPEEDEGYLLLQEDCVSVDVNIFVGTGTVRTLVTTLHPSVSEVLNDTLQTVGTWKRIKGGQGGNFKYRIPAEAFPFGGVHYRIEAIINLADGTQAPGLWEVPAAFLFTSGLGV